jgi:hypothetical protein
MLQSRGGRWGCSPRSAASQRTVRGVRDAALQGRNPLDASELTCRLLTRGPSQTGCGRATYEQAFLGYRTLVSSLWKSATFVGNVGNQEGENHVVVISACRASSHVSLSGGTQKRVWWGKASAGRQRRRSHMVPVVRSHPTPHLVLPSSSPDFSARILLEASQGTYATGHTRLITGADEAEVALVLGLSLP